MLTYVSHRSYRFTLRFDDTKGYLIYRHPKKNIVLGSESQPAIHRPLLPNGVTAMSVNIVHNETAKHDNGFFETCIRVAGEYYVRNTLTVRLDDGSVTMRVGDQFRVPLRFSNVSFKLDKHTHQEIPCELWLASHGMYKSI